MRERAVVNDEVLVKVEGVSKKFCRSLKRSLWYGVQDVVTEVLGREGNHDELRKNEFWAVQDVSFELNRGECLGLIGPNGAGKSTLLKMLNGLVKPDKGRITMRGRIGALIELGAGFNPILTGRENVYINGSVLGFSKKEIDHRFDAIVDFAEIEEFIDTPVQNYSSGMKVRLGFAVCGQMEPDVLIIDEVLAVGDAAFRMKCLNQILRVSQDCAAIVVSHSMPMISRLSTHAISMSSGEVEYSGESVNVAIEKYLGHVDSTEKGEFSSIGISLSEFRINDARPPEPTFGYRVESGSAVSGEITFEVKQPCPPSYVDLTFMDMEGRPVAQSFSLMSNFKVPASDKQLRIRFEITSLTLNPGRYIVQLGLVEALEHGGRGTIFYRNLDVSTVTVSGLVVGWAPVQLAGRWEMFG
jgi:lipopolysaccharide transport system ATP-binding protein